MWRILGMEEDIGVQARQIFPPMTVATMTREVSLHKVFVSFRQLTVSFLERNNIFLNE